MPPSSPISAFVPLARAASDVVALGVQLVPRWRRARQDEGRDRPNVDGQLPARAGRRRPVRSGGEVIGSGGSHTVFTMEARRALPYGGDGREEHRGLPGRPRRPFSRSRSTDGADAARRGDMTTTRSARNTASEMEWVTKTVLSRSARRSRAVRAASARGSARRAHRTARPSAAAAGARRAPGRSPPAAACRRRARRVLAGEVGQADQVQKLLGAGPRSARRRPRSSSGSSTLAATVRQSKSPGSGRRCRNPGPAGPHDGLAVDRDLPAGRRDQVGDQAQQRALAAAGRPDRETNSPAPTFRSTSDRAVDLIRAALIEDFGHTRNGNSIRS